MDNASTAGCRSIGRVRHGKCCFCRLSSDQFLRASRDMKVLVWDYQSASENSSESVWQNFRSNHEDQCSALSVNTAKLPFHSVNHSCLLNVVSGSIHASVCHCAAEIFNFNQQLCKLKISVKPRKSILALLVVSRLQDWFQIEFSQHWFWGLQISTDNPVGNSRSTSPSVSIKVLEQQLERPGVVTNLLSEIHIYVYLSYTLAVSIDRNPINGNISNGTTVSLTFMNHGQRYSHTSFWIRSRRRLSIQETTPYSTGRPLWLGDSCWCWAKS